MIPKLNQTVLQKYEFTKLLHECYENEAPKITFVQNINKEYKFKLHFLELIYESNLWHKTFIKGVKEVLEEATPLLKMCLTKNNSSKSIEKISFERLHRLLDVPVEGQNPINVSTPLKEHIKNTEVASHNNPIKVNTEDLIINNNHDPIDYNSVIKQKFDFTGNFVNFDISESEEDETPKIDLFSQAQKKVKMEPLNSMEIVEEINEPKQIEGIDTKIYEKGLSNSYETMEEISVPATNKLNETKNNESTSVYEIMTINSKENIKSVTSFNEHTEIINSEGTGVYETKLLNFIKENSLPIFSKKFKVLKKLHKCIVTFIDDCYESKFNLSPQKAEDEVFKQICDDYEL